MKLRLDSKELITNISLLFLSFIFSFVLVEVALRSISPAPVFDPALSMRPYVREMWYPKLKGVSETIYHSTNKWGMRGPPPPINWDGYYTIITIGGSTTQCFYLDDRKTWSHLLQENLRSTYHNKVWVGNAGLDGHSSRGNLLMMERVIPVIKPKCVILLTGINDLEISLSQDEYNKGRSYDNRFLSGFKNRVSRIHKILSYIRVYQILYDWKRILFDKVVVNTKVGHCQYEPKPNTFNPVESTLPSDYKSESVLVSLPEFRCNIRKIIAIAKAYDIRLIILTNPLLYEDNNYWSRIQYSAFWNRNQRLILSAAEYSKLLNVFNEEIIKISREENIEIFDLAKEIPHSMNYFYDPCHFTEKGAELISKEIADYMVNHKESRDG